MNSPNPNFSEHMRQQDYYGEVSFDDLNHLEDISKVHTDDELEVVIKELLMNSKKLDANDITVTVDKGNVTLSGTVKTQYERDYASSVVKLVQGVGDVHADLMVKQTPN